jgi:flagellar biosynthesis/type III secretory pathway chaperone
MDKAIKDGFIDIVNRQTALYKALEGVIKEEQDALSAGDIKKVDGIVKKEEAAISEIKELEREKYPLFSSMALACGFSKDSGVKLGEVLLKIGGDEAREIEKAVVGLLNAARDVEMTNKNNALLLKNYAGYVSAVKMFKEKLEKKPEHETYTAKGAIKKEKTVDKSGIDRTI